MFRPRLILASVLLAAALVAAGLSHAGISFSTAVRTSMMQAIITAAGSSAKLKLYNGTVPSGVSAVTGGNTLLATITFGATIGTATNGTIDWDEAGVSQAAASHTSGTPTFAHITTSGDVVVARIDICGSAPCWTFSGSVATGQNVTLTGLVFTAGNP